MAEHIRNTERCSNTKRGRSRQERISVHELEGTLRSASRSSLPRPGSTQGPRLGESMLLGHRVSSPPSSAAVTRTCLLHEMLPVRPPPVRGPRLLLRSAAVPLEAPVLLQSLQVAHVNVLVGHRPERGRPAAEGHCGQRPGCHAGFRPRLKPKAGTAGPQELPKPTHHSPEVLKPRHLPLADNAARHQGAAIFPQDARDVRRTQTEVASEKPALPTGGSAPPRPAPPPSEAPTRPSEGSALRTQYPDLILKAQGRFLGRQGYKLHLG